MYEKVDRVLARDFTVTRVQASAFFASDDFRPGAILGDLLREWGSVYDAEPVSIPLPPGVPGDVPSVILSSKDASLHAELARERVNLSWQKQGDAVVDMKDIYPVFADRIDFIASRGNAPIGRLAAFIIRRAAHPQPGMSLAQQFCREEYLNGSLTRPEGFELHAHKVFKLYDDLQVNSWVRVKTAQGIDQRYSHIVVEQDINSLAEELSSRRFPKQGIAEFFDQVSAESETIFRLYFPDLVKKEDAKG